MTSIEIVVYVASTVICLIGSGIFLYALYEEDVEMIKANSCQDLEFTYLTVFMALTIPFLPIFNTVLIVGAIGAGIYHLATKFNGPIVFLLKKSKKLDQEEAPLPIHREKDQNEKT